MMSVLFVLGAIFQLLLSGRPIYENNYIAFHPNDNPTFVDGLSK